ncbi:hypothetical protein NQT66_14810 [Cellulophaga baltica]|uniref:hypothetical protein n=1 Tax=Cellulophaga baltica TaxID=76594 RepID=UPI0021489250|nr:hypothetical protein [Cellulophaga baltica]MCR1026091.1 hypothetical protein [Cellulophaga baltica]
MNNEIGNKLSETFELNRTSFLSKMELHPLFEEFKPFVSEINIENLTLQFQSEIDINITEWWTNKEKKVDLESKIFAILFTHRDLCDKEPEANVYGINETRTPLKLQLEPYLLDSHDYADGYYAMPGITLGFCKELHKLDWTSLKNTDYEDVDWYELDGRLELFNTYKFAIKLALHKALKKLMSQNRFSEINSINPLHFLIQEYDEQVYPLLFMD